MLASPLVSSLNAQTTIVGSDTLDGGFESGGTDTPWMGTVAFSTQTVRTGTQALSVGTTTAAYQNTGYTVTGSDTLSFEFYAGPRFAWDADDVIIATLYTTDDNTYSGNATEIATYSATGFANIGNFSGGAGFETDSFGGDTVISSLDSGTQASVIGQQLFVEFTSVSGSGEFGRVDDVTLTAVTAIPEPSTAALIAGLAGLAFVINRRRKA